MMQSQASVEEFEETPAVLSDLMVMTVDGMRMLVPQKEIDTFESIHDLNTKDALRNSIGWVKSHGKELPVYSFT